MTPLSALITVWVAWVISWFLAAGWANRTQARPPAGEELAYRTVTLAGVLLLFWGHRLPAHGLRLWRAPEAVEWVLVAVAVAGFGVCWWARLHLGRLWSGSVTLKADHRVIDTGPYALVRHPIYSGLILSASATALLLGEASGIVGFLLMVLSFWIKARLEERFLRAELGAEAYDAYAARVGMLFPGLGTLP